MKRSYLSFILAAMLLAPSFLFAGGSSDSCDTRYPVVLAHGMMATDDMLGFVDYWWGIEDALEDEGAEVYVTAVNAMDSTEAKAAQFREQFLQILAISGSSKANIIGHSHGGIYTRYAASNLGLADKIASHTSYCSPQRGSAVADVLLGLLPDSGEWLVGSVLDYAYAFVLGDTNPDSLANAYAVSRPYMNDVFNPNVPNQSQIYYQSYATKVKYAASDIVLTPTWLLLLAYEGPNDGLVAVNSAKWGNYRGVDSGSWWGPGVTHINAIGHLFGVTPGFSAPDKLVDMVADLKDQGF